MYSTLKFMRPTCGKSKVRYEKLLSYFKASARSVDKVNIITYNLGALRHPYEIYQLKI